MITFVAMTKDHDYNHVTQRQIIEKQNGHYRILNPFNPGKYSKPHSRCTNPANMHSPPQQQTIPAISMPAPHHTSNQSSVVRVTHTQVRDWVAGQYYCAAQPSFRHTCHDAALYHTL